MLCRVPPNRLQTEIVGISPVDLHETIEHVVSMLVDSGERRPRILCDEQTERLRFGSHAFVRVDLRAFRMIDRYELKAIQKECFFELVRDSQLEPAMSLAQAAAGDSDIFIRVWTVMQAGRQPVPH